MDIKQFIRGIYRKEINSNTIVFLTAAQRNKLCTMKYPGHPRGCPNFNKNPTCPPSARIRSEIFDIYSSFELLICEINLLAYANAMQDKRKKEGKSCWTERQLRNPLYWQRSAKIIIENEIRRIGPDGVFGCGSGMFGESSMEAAGIDVFTTLENNNIILEKCHPLNTVRLVCLLMWNTEDVILSKIEVPVFQELAALA